MNDNVTRTFFFGGGGGIKGANFTKGGNKAVHALWKFSGRCSRTPPVKILRGGGEQVFKKL